MYRAASTATVHRVAKNWTRLKQPSTVHSTWGTYLKLIYAFWKVFTHVNTPQSRYWIYSSLLKVFCKNYPVTAYVIIPAPPYQATKALILSLDINLGFLQFYIYWNHTFLFYFILFFFWMFRKILFYFFFPSSGFLFIFFLILFYF